MLALLSDPVEDFVRIKCFVISDWELLYKLKQRKLFAFK